MHSLCALQLCCKRIARQVLVSVQKKAGTERAYHQRHCRKLMPQAINGTEGSGVLKRYHKRPIIFQARNSPHYRRECDKVLHNMQY